MKTLKRLKPYKSTTPAGTIGSIRKILEDCNIFASEFPYSPTAEKFHSCGVIINDEKIGDLQIGTFGKGLTAQYSLASAYAEFIERLQNNVLFFNRYGLQFPLRSATKEYLESGLAPAGYRQKLESENLTLDFLFGPDEKHFPADEAVKMFYPTLKHLFAEDSQTALLDILRTKLKREKVPGVPFYNVSKKSVEYIPLELVYRTSVSTGMCAGNTPEEAIIHGICEIFERYAVKKIYTDELTPPTIPLEHFYGTDIYNKLQYIINVRKMGVIIKDCSLGMKLPVIGVIVIDHRTGRYTFNLGSDPSPITALERCISEMYQGGENIHFSDLHFSSDPFDTANGRSVDQNKSDHYYDTLFVGMGCWPNSIFSADESYRFNDFERSITESDDDDLEYVVDTVHRLGFDLYVRDVSYLGFPSYFVYIPGMSEGKYSFHSEFLLSMEEIDRQLPTLYNVKNASTEELEKLADVLDTACDNSRSFDLTQVFLHNNAEFLRTMEPEIFLLMLFYRLSNYEKAFKYLNLYLEAQKSRGKPRQMFHLCLKDYLKLKIEKQSDENIETILNQLYGPQVSKSVIDEFAHPETIFNSSPLPSCFNCAECDLRLNCRHFDVLKLARELQDKYKEAVIDQSALGTLF